jgi:SacI homology domain
MTLPADSSSVRSISIYESRTLILISGLSVESNGYFLLRITRAPVSAGQKQVLADAKQYSKEEVNSIVTETKCVSIMVDACCIFGFIKLVESIYIVVITKAACVANIHGHDIYTVRETNLVPITYKARNTMDESRYKSILQNLNLAYNDFYFSYTYDLFKSVQHNCLAKSTSVYRESLETRFIWNYYAIQQFLNCKIEDKRVTVSVNDNVGKAVPPSPSPVQRWLVPLIHGFLKQTTIRLAAECSFKYTLISRRSRMFAGTRYLRRGVDPDGFSANEVETEQIVTRLGSGNGSGSGENNSYRSSSLIQIRGSVPLYWYQTNLFVPSPDIKIDDIDHGYDAGLHHFNLLKEFYGEHLTVLNLVRSQNSTREVILGAAFEEFIVALNAYYQGLESKRQNDQIDEGDIDVIQGQYKDKRGNTDKPNNKDKHGDIDRDNDNDKDVSMSTRSTSVGYIAFDFHSAPHNTLFSQLDDICEKIFPSSGFYLQSVSEAEDLNNRCSSTDSTSSSSLSSWTAVSELEGFLSLKSITTPSRDDSNPLPLPLPHSHVVDRTDIHVSNGHTQESSEIDESYKKEKEERNEIGSGIRSGFLQRGVLRTNCVDCLDRTNVAQFCYARLSLMHQLKALGESLSAPVIVSVCVSVSRSINQSLIHSMIDKLII